MRPSDVRTAEDVSILGTELLGVDPAVAGGCLQTVATWLDGTGTRVALRICEATPRSETDFFLLNLARARAEAIVTTGRTLREEADVTHALQGPALVPDALAEWRRNVLGLGEPPLLLVLSSGRGLEPDHPAFHAPLRPILFVPEAAAAPLRARFEGSAAVEGRPRTGARQAVEWLRAQGATRITVEAGPSASAALYEEPCLADELWRSTYLEHELLSEVVGPALVPDAHLDGLLPVRTGGETVREPSGPWRFERRAAA